MQVTHQNAKNIFNHDITCEYDGKPRAGKVVAVLPTYCKLEFVAPDTGKVSYRSLSYGKMLNVNIVK